VGTSAGHAIHFRRPCVGRFVPVFGRFGSLSLSDAGEVRAGGLLAPPFARSEGMGPTRQTIKIERHWQGVCDRPSAQVQQKRT